MQIAPYILYFHILSCLLTAVFAIWALQLKQRPLVKYFIRSLLGLSCWAATAAAYNLLDSGPAAIVFYKLRSVFVFLAAYQTFLLAQCFAGVNHENLRYLERILKLTLAIYTALLITNPWHQWIFADSGVVDNVGALISVPLFGIGYHIQTFSSLSLAFYTLWVFLKCYLSGSGTFRKQAAVFLIGYAIPIFTIAFTLTLGHELRPLLLGPASFFITGTLFFWGMQRYQVLKVVPYEKQVIFDKMPTPILIFSHDGLIAANQAAMDLFLLKEESLCDRDCAQILESIRNKATFEKAGRIFEITTDHFPINDHHSATSYSFLDITEKKRTLEELYLRNQVRAQIYSMIGHDLKGNIANIKLFSELISKAVPEGNITLSNELIQLLSEAANTTQGFIENVQQWTQIHNDQISLNIEKVQIKKLIDDVTAYDKIRLQLKEIHIENTIDPNLHTQLDVELTSAILRNFLSNAITHSKPGGVISIKANQTKASTFLSVTDHGVGMSPEKVAEILSPSYLSLRTKNLKRGLGLYICRDFAEKQGGKIHCQSTLNIGTTLQLELPNLAN